MNELLTLSYLRTNHCLYLTNVDFFTYNQKRKLEINDYNIDVNTLCKAKIFKIRWTDEEDIRPIFCDLVDDTKSNISEKYSKV